MKIPSGLVVELLDLQQGLLLEVGQIAAQLVDLGIEVRGPYLGEEALPGARHARRGYARARRLSPGGPSRTRAPTHRVVCANLQLNMVQWPLEGG